MKGDNRSRPPDRRMAMNTVFPFTSEPSIGSSAVSESAMDIPAQPGGNLRKNKQGRKSLTKSMERWLFGFVVLMVVLFALFVQYDPHQAGNGYAKEHTHHRERSKGIPPTRSNYGFVRHGVNDEFDPGNTQKTQNQGNIHETSPNPGPQWAVLPPAPPADFPSQGETFQRYPYPVPGYPNYYSGQYVIVDGRESKPEEQAEKQKLQNFYPMYQDVHVMIFIGFGFLMTFLKKYGYSAVGLTMLLSAIAIQWAIICRAVFHHDEHGMMNLEITTLINADFAAGAVLISLGAVLGITSPFQLMVMVIIEVFLYELNEYIGAEIFQAIDVGGSMFIHCFGAYFGLALSRMLKSSKDISYEKEGATKNSDLFAMIGTIFLWIYWPSFNGALASGDDQHRAVINTLLSLTGSLLMTYVWSGILSRENKLDMVHIQNATLAGGVAVGAVADLMIRPYGALIIGGVAGTISTMGYVYLTPKLRSKAGLHDTCGVHNLHGMPAILAGIAGVVMAGIATEDMYGASLYKQYAARAPMINSTELSELQNEFPGIEPGENRTAGNQALYQLAALGVTLAISIVGGSLTGLLLRAPVFDSVPDEQHFDDAYFWEIPEDDEKAKLVQEGNGVTNKTFDFEMAMDTKNAASNQEI